MEQRFLKNNILLALVLPFIFLLVAPLSFFLGNFAEINANLSEIVYFLISLWLPLTALLALLLLGLSRWHKPYALLSGLLVGLALAGWLQSQILLWHFGVLDGHPIDWSLWTLHARMEAILWVTVIAATLFLAFYAPKKLLIAAKLGLFLGGLSLLGNGFYSGYATTMRQQNQASLFSFHEKNNKILIVLDTFQSDVFQEIAERWPSEVEFLQGFVFYPNTVGGFSTTKASLPLIMTGKFYKNDVPMMEWINKTNQHANIADYHVNKGYGASLFSIIPLTLMGIKAPIVFIGGFSSSNFVTSLHSGLLALDGGLFRLAPTQIKPLVYNNGQWLLSTFSVQESEVGTHKDDIRLLKAFVEKAAVNSTKTGEFKLFHYTGTHPPFDRDEYFEYEDMPATRESFVRQARGVLHFLRNKLKRLHQLGIYESAEILVVGDHGSTFQPRDFKGIVYPNEPENLEAVLGRARPLFLYKASGSNQKLGYADTPLHLADAVCILSQNDPLFDCKETPLTATNATRKRPFYFYEWGTEDWEKEYMPPMQEYVVRGDVREKEAWHAKYRTLSAGKISLINYYTLGMPLVFSSKGNAEPFLGQGWSGAEATHRWTDGAISRIVLNLGKTKHEALSLRLYAGAFPTKDKGPQPVDLLVNGQKVASWQLYPASQWIEATIPAAMVTNSIVEIRFLMQEPTAPCELNATREGDCRKLGIKAEQLIINKALA
ncbi:MAG: sulfatase-like hydrolase/transferase [Tatlockia sp.]|jgi:hypothetical protein